MKNKVSKINFLSRINFSGLMIAYLILFILLSISSPNFLTVSNIIIVVRQAVFVAIMGMGMTFVIAMGGIDLSVGAILGITGVSVASFILSGVNIYLAIFLTMVLGTIIGFINGVSITKLKIPAFIATLGVMSIARGAIMVYTHGIPIYGLQFPSFQFLAQGFLGPVPFPIIITLFLLFICFYLMYKTKLGRYTIAIGSNPEAAKLVGININEIKVIVYSLSGFLCSIAGILMTSRSEAAVAQAGSGNELDVIAATVIGGTSLSGGRANVIGTVFGSILMTTIRNGLNLLNINVYWHQVVIGIFILLAVAIDQLSTQKQQNKDKAGA